MVYRTALLDLDDTTLNREESVSCFIDRFLEKFTHDIEPAFLPKLKPLFIEIDNRGYTPREEMFAELYKRFEWVSKPDIQEIKHYWNSELPRCAQPMTGLYETLEFLRGKGMKIAIVTNGTSQMQNVKVDMLDLRKYVDAIVISEEAGFRKPDIRIFQLALSQLNANSVGAFFVGDDPAADIAGAKAAGLTAIWMSGGRPWNEERYKPDYWIDILPEIQRIINDFN